MNQMIQIYFKKRTMPLGKWCVYGVSSLTHLITRPALGFGGFGIE